MLDDSHGVFLEALSLAAGGLAIAVGKEREVPVFIKQEAVRLLISGALQAFEKGDFVCALTLAGAAEGAMPPTQHAFFPLFRDIIATFDKRSEKSVADELNLERNWLKHYSINEAATITVGANSARLMLIRAWSCYAANYGERQARDEFQEFFVLLRRHA